MRLQKKAAIADKVHLLLELKKNAAPIPITPKHLFSAGKDGTNVELIYAPTRETIINSAKVESLRSLFFDQQGKGTIRYAPFANSSDGLGGKLPANEPKWSGFGNSSLPPAEIGFAIASPVLRMKEGDRQVTVSLQLNNVDPTKLNNLSLQDAFEVYITGEKSWLSCLVSSSLSPDNMLTLNFTVDKSEKAVIDYNPAIHGYFYSTQAPIVQVLLRNNNTNIGYKNFRNVTLQSAAVSVEVENINSLHLESDSGTLDPKKAFLPFGFQPTKGSRFLVGYPEALAKKLSEIALKMQWKDVPKNFSSHYSDYEYEQDIDNSYFTTAVSFNDGGSWENESFGVQLFNSKDAALLHPLKFSPNSSSSSSGAVSLSSGVNQGMEIYTLSMTNSLWALDAAKSLVWKNLSFLPIKLLSPNLRLDLSLFP